jgi:FKBP-type peptidyl-prolyl cis-trans isomerase SlyD
MTQARDLTVGPGRVVSIFFKVLDEQGRVLDSSDRLGHKPLVFLCGANNVLPGLEKLLEGKRKDDFVSGVIAPEDAYGARHEKLVETVRRDRIPVQGDLRAGMRLDGYDPNGRRISALIAGVDGDEVTIDRNHPLAGQSIRFEATVASVRAATKEELEHSHVHGPGGHAH